MVSSEDEQWSSESSFPSRDPVLQKPCPLHSSVRVTVPQPGPAPPSSVVLFSSGPSAASVTHEVAVL